MEAGFLSPQTAAEKVLEHYAARLNAVEINYTFHRTPSASTIENWVRLTPEGFRFCLKAHRKITHFLRLENAKQMTEFFLRAIDPLRVTGRLGVVLFQLPPYFRRDVDVLGGFVKDLPPDVRCTFEFRHESWRDEAVYRVLEDRNIAYCLAESEKLEPPDVITADFVYFRLRKPHYSPADRAAIEEKAGGMLADGKSVFLFFKHEDTPAGALYAEQALAKLGGAP